MIRCKQAFLAMTDSSLDRQTSDEELLAASWSHGSRGLGAVGGKQQEVHEGGLRGQGTDWMGDGDGDGGVDSVV